MTHGAAPVWPKLLREVADALGEEAALKLAKTCGGQRIYVNQRPRRGTELRDILGADLFDFLAGHWDGPWFKVPKADGLRTERRRLEVLNNPDESANALAKRLGMTSERVYQIRQADRQRQTILNNPGLSANAVADRFGIPVRRVRKIRQEDEAPAFQPSLFDLDD